MKKVVLLSLLLWTASCVYSLENQSYSIGEACFSYNIDSDHHETKKLKKTEQVTCIQNFIDAFEDNGKIIGPFFH